MSIYTMGIDVGSTSSKCVILKDGQEIVCKSLVASGTGTSGPDRAVAELREKSGVKGPISSQPATAATQSTG